MSSHHFVFKGFQFRRDEAFGVFKGLPALVVGRCLFGLGFGQFNVKAVNAVELNFECGQTGTFAFLGFQIQQKFVAMVLNAAQFVQFGMKTVVDDIAVFQPDGRFGQNGLAELFGCG